MDVVSFKKYVIKGFVNPKKVVLVTDEFSRIEILTFGKVMEAK